MLPGRSGVRPSTFDQTVRVCELLYKKLEIGEYAGPSGLKRINLDWSVLYTQSNGMGTALLYYLLHMYRYMVLGLQGGTPCLSSTSTQNSRKPQRKDNLWGSQIKRDPITRDYLDLPLRKMFSSRSQLREHQRSGGDFEETLQNLLERDQYSVATLGPSFYRRLALGGKDNMSKWDLDDWDRWKKPGWKHDARHPYKTDCQWQ